MKKVDELKAKLQPGQVYHRKGLTRWSKAIDRHLKALLAEWRPYQTFTGALLLSKANDLWGCAARGKNFDQSLLKR